MNAEKVVLLTAMKSLKLERLANYQKQIGLYVLTRLLLAGMVTVYLDSASFLDDIHVLYYYGTHPLSIILGTFSEGAGRAFGAYAPLEPFAYAPFTAAWRSIDGVRLATFTFELLTLLALILFGNRVSGEEALRKAVLLYIFLPLFWVENIIGAQDEILAALFLVIILHFKLTNRECRAALFLGLACVFAKITLLIILVPLLLTARNRKQTLFLAIFPVLAVYVPVHYSFARLGIASPFLSQIRQDLAIGALTIPYLFKLAAPAVRLGLLPFTLTCLAYIVYYAYLFYLYRRKRLPAFIDMVIASFLIYFLFFMGALHPEHYMFVLPVLLLRLAMLGKINGKEVLLLVVLSISSETWKVLHLLSRVSGDPARVSRYYGLMQGPMDFLTNLVGGQFFRLEEAVLVLVAVAIVMRYLLLFQNSGHWVRGIGVWCQSRRSITCG